MYNTIVDHLSLLGCGSPRLCPAPVPYCFSRMPSRFSPLPMKQASRPPPALHLLAWVSVLAALFACGARFIDRHHSSDGLIQAELHPKYSDSGAVFELGDGKHGHTLGGAFRIQESDTTVSTVKVSENIARIHCGGTSEPHSSLELSYWVLNANSVQVASLCDADRCIRVVGGEEPELCFRGTVSTEYMAGNGGRQETACPVSLASTSRFTCFIVTVLLMLLTMRAAKNPKTLATVPRRIPHWFSVSVLLVETLSSFAHASIVETKLTASDGVIYDEFGKIVAIDGDIALVGASYGMWKIRTRVLHILQCQCERDICALCYADTVCTDDDSSSDSGSVYIFMRDHPSADAWGQFAKLTASDAAGFDYFGSSVAIAGDSALIGAPGGT